MALQRAVLLAMDAPTGNPNHDPKNGEFTSGSGGGSKKATPTAQAEFEGPVKSNPEAERKGGKTEEQESQSETKYKTALNSEYGRKAHRSIAAAFNSGKSMKLGAYTTDGKAIYLHGNKIVEKGDNGEISFTMAGWPTNTTRSSLSDFGIKVSTSGGERGGRGGKNIYTHSGGSEEIDPSATYRARDEQPALALDPSSAAPQYKGRNLDDNPVGDCYATTPTHDAGGAVWAGRTLD
jgi:hypothetical protein